MRAEQVFIVSEGAIENPWFFGAAWEKPGERKQSSAESLNACGNRALTRTRQRCLQ